MNLGLDWDQEPTVFNTEGVNYVGVIEMRWRSSVKKSSCEVCMESSVGVQRV